MFSKPIQVFVPMFFSSSPPCTAVILAVIKIEKGDEGVAIGMYFRVLIVLGLQDDLSLIARDDVLGRKLQDIGLTTPRRASKRPTIKD